MLDERVVELSLTEQGAVRAQEIREQIDLRCSAAVSTLTPEEMQNIVDSLKRMNEMLICIKNTPVPAKEEK